MLELHRRSSYEVTWDKTVMNRPFKQIKPEVKVELISVLYHKMKKVVSEIIKLCIKWILAQTFLKVK